jgi:2',3'-cyclic-nucleotide 2'-phosphodiesterase (5'-nucleotidase family)
LANFPFLAINIYDRATNQRVDYCDGSLLVEMGDVKIGIIGAIGDCYSSISSDKVTDIYFKTGSALTTLVQNEASSLRAQGADFIIYTIHDGYGSSTSGNISDSQLKSYYDISLSNCVDLVFEGHTHQRYVLKDSKGVYHLQDGGDNDGISHVQVKINFANEQSKVQQAEFVSTGVYSGLADDPVVNNLLAKYNDEIVKAGRVLGNNDKTRYSNEILQKVADLYYEAGLKRWGADYDIVLGGGFMSARSPYNIYAGEVLYGDLMSVLPFDNQLVLCSISGAKLKSQFFETDNNRYYISYGEYGATVKANIVANKTYYVVTDTYSSQYAPNGMTEVARYDETTFARDLLADFIEDGGWGQPAGEVILTSIPEILALGAGLANNEETSKIYYVQGEIVSITSPNLYGNMTIKDENGNTLYIYGTWDKSGANRYGNMNNPPQVGDKVVLVGAIKKYNGTIEMIDGRFYDIMWLPE